MNKFTLGLVSVLFLAVQSALGIEGNYSIVEGKSGDGSSYSGSVVIKKVGEAYNLNWLIDKSGEQYGGVGILKGDILSVAWGGGNVVGVIGYKVNGTSLEGTWTTAGSSKLGTEVLALKK